MRLLLRWTVAVLAGAVVICASAQPGGGAIEAEPTDRSARCVVMSQEPLAYPAGMAARKAGATIRVRLTFASADTGPRAEVFFDGAGDPFRAIVLDRVAAYRLPCWRADQRNVVMTQEFVFTPGDGRRVVWSHLRDEPRRGADSPLACLTGAGKVPDYPQSILSRAANGNVFVRYEFTRNDQPPLVAVLFDGGSPRFADVAKEYGAGLRLPCLRSADAPVMVVQRISFVMSGTRRSVLRDMNLATFVGSMEKLEDQRVSFDFATMGCPFELRFELRQPVLPNAVGELERSDPNRREFIEWLKTVDLKLPSGARAQVIGDEMTLSVPCGRLDLT